MNLKTIKIYKKNNGRLAVPSSQPRGEICGHGAPIKKKKEKSCAQKERKIIQKHTHKASQVSYNILIPRFLSFPSLLNDFLLSDG